MRSIPLHDEGENRGHDENENRGHDENENRGHDDNDHDQEIHLFDFFNIPNALFRFLNPVSARATVSFDIRWSGPVTDRSHVSDPTVGFAGDFVLNQATMTWSAANSDGFRFVSNPSGTTSAFAQLGHMRNGVFFDE